MFSMILRVFLVSRFLYIVQTQSTSSKQALDSTTALVSSQSPHPTDPTAIHTTSDESDITAAGKTVMSGSRGEQTLVTSSPGDLIPSTTVEHADPTYVPVMLVVLVIHELIINEPDDKFIHSGGGQALDFTVTVSSTNNSSYVSGDNNWSIQGFVTDVDNGMQAAGAIQAQLSDVHLGAYLPPGGNYTFSNIVMALDLTQVSCSELSHFCVMVSPSASANWSLDSDSSMHMKCEDVFCSDGGNQIGLAMYIMIILPIIAHLCSKP